MQRHTQTTAGRRRARPGAATTAAVTATLLVALLASTARAFVPTTPPRAAASTSAASKKGPSSSPLPVLPTTATAAAGSVLDAPSTTTSASAAVAAAAAPSGAAVRPIRRRRRSQQAQAAAEEEAATLAAVSMEALAVPAAAAAAASEATSSSKAKPTAASKPKAPAIVTPEERRTRARVRALQRAAAAVAQQKELGKELGRAPTEAEWAAALGLSAEALRGSLEHGARAREELAQGWAGLVRKLVARHATFLPASELEDLADEGFAGLMEAALRFKAGEAQFSTYAFYWVKKRVLAAVAARDRTTFQSAGEHALGAKVQQAMQAGYEAHGRWPSLEEVGVAVGVTPERAEQLLRRGRRYQLLEASGSGFGRMADTLSDPEAPGADGALEALYLAEVEAGVGQALSELPEEERTVLALRLGLRDGQPKSWEELGRLMQGCSVSYLRKVEARAKTHLRRNVEMVKLLHRRPPSLFDDVVA